MALRISFLIFSGVFAVSLSALAHVKLMKVDKLIVANQNPRFSQIVMSDSKSSIEFTCLSSSPELTIREDGLESKYTTSEEDFYGLGCWKFLKVVASLGVKVSSLIRVGFFGPDIDRSFFISTQSSGAALYLIDDVARPTVFVSK